MKKWDWDIFSSHNKFSDLFRITPWVYSRFSL